MKAALNWIELSKWVEMLRPELEGLFVERILIPARKRFPDGFIKGEWCILLGGPGRSRALVFSVRARAPYVYITSGKAVSAASSATHSAFDLSLSKELRGLKLESIQAVPEERYVVIQFGEKSLVLALIPAMPEAILVETGSMLARSRRPNELGPFSLPAKRVTPSGLSARAELIESLEKYRQAVEMELEGDAFALRLQRAESATRDLLKQARNRKAQSQTAIREGEAENDWQRFGDLLKPMLGRPLETLTEGGKRFALAMDYETGENARVPIDPKLETKAQVEKFYHLARRKILRLEEARARLAQLAEAERKFATNLATPVRDLDWSALEILERGANIAPDRSADGGKTARAKSYRTWLGKVFTAQDGSSILVGRSRDENLELTFKCARGNDLWMHVRGRPGAHVVVPLSSGKSAPLETLLDAAALTLHYSGGEKWGKTEVDYTFKKYVKRIKDSTEASYTNNKTLIVEPDAERIRRLFSEGE